MFRTSVNLCILYCSSVIPPQFKNLFQFSNHCFYFHLQEDAVAQRKSVQSLAAGRGLGGSSLMCNVSR